MKLNPGENLLNKCQGYLVDLNFLESKIVEKIELIATVVFQSHDVYNSSKHDIIGPKTLSNGYGDYQVSHESNKHFVKSPGCL